MPVRRAVALYENVRRFVWELRRVRLTELARCLESVLSITVLRLTFRSVAAALAIRQLRPWVVRLPYGLCAFVKSTAAALGAFARTVVVTRRSGYCGFLKTTS